jgi:ribosome-binding factor A
MKQERADRIGEALRAELAQMLEQREIKDPRIGFVSITRVAVTRDLSLARIGLSVLKPEEEGPTLEGLRSAAGFLRGELARRLRLRLAPALEFYVDRSIAESLRVQQLMREALPRREETERP